MNVYEKCPEISDQWYGIRSVRETDCEDLLKVYSDKKAVPLFNSDNCNGDDFNYKTYDQMMEGIRMWLRSYEGGWFVRWSIVDKEIDKFIGTIELFRRESADYFNDCGILRLDLRSDYENEQDITKILSLIVTPSFEWFGCSMVATKAKASARIRIKVLEEVGFKKSNEMLIGHDGTAYGDYYVLSKRLVMVE